MDLIGIPWLLLLAYWAVSAFRVRPSQRVEPITSRLIVLIGVILGFSALFGHWWQSSFLGKRFVPESSGIRFFGIALTWVGVAIAMWARYHLGEYWSARITIKVGHKLIDSGPYAHVRHPIYSGILLGLIGTAFAVGKWRGVFTFFLILAVFSLKAAKEEKWLAKELGGEYSEYKQRTGMLVPGLG